MCNRALKGSRWVGYTFSPSLPYKVQLSREGLRGREIINEPFKVTSTDRRGAHLFRSENHGNREKRRDRLTSSLVTVYEPLKTSIFGVRAKAFPPRNDEILTGTKAELSNASDPPT
ncbi:hypothetical protein DPMN_140709 [Dreissena polymorpha]|uniref:Uncharacterized protein n=1 Tax=Dreissena polymorpha TaxID=45954 RepID=A0A9D4JKL9_DREPO|nr:hypothetical protein DPMN_140709 [Dreissena polymorpha]